MRLSVCAVALALVCLSFASCSDSQQSKNSATPSPTNASIGTIVITSPAFKDGQMIPQKYSCDGENVSPPLEWNGVPGGTKELALIVDDPDAPGKTWVHWVVYDLPPETTSLPENMTAKVEPAKLPKQGMNDFKKTAYGGPCPPSATHRYYFKVYALNDRTSFASPATKDDLLKSIEGHILAQGQLMGRYQR